ncbi:MAG: hypothetical protein HYT87_14305 [Nitrospirae bacterium]|nr:hypothetical protein [Nitrospirota bacterium]
MAYDEFDESDPMEFQAVSIPGDPAVMARAFIEEYALAGMGPERILMLFKTPFYHGTHRLYGQLGEGFIRKEIRAVFRSEVCS